MKLYIYIIYTYTYTQVRVMRVYIACNFHSLTIRRVVATFMNCLIKLNATEREKDSF